MQTLLISELIEELENIMANEGDLPVVIASDDEGNGYNTINTAFAQPIHEEKKGAIVLLPSGYVEDIEDVFEDAEDDNEEDED